MKWLAFVVLGACQFDPTPATTATDGPITDGPAVTDGSDPDSPATTGSVRSIDITDAQVKGGPHTDFPLLISLTETYLRDAGHGGDVARADGFDLFFSADQAGATRLAHEIETYDETTGTLIAWVKIPSLSGATTLFLHYGDPANTSDPQMTTAVWSNGYALVAHMDDSSDSTAKANQISASTSGAAAGRIGQATSFNGTSDLVDFGSDASVDDVFSAGGSAEAWFQADTAGEGSRGRLFDKGTWLLMTDDFNVTRTVSFIHAGAAQGTWAAPDNSITFGTWHHVIVNYDQSSSANDATMFLDGNPVAVIERDTPSSPASDASSPIVVGNTSDQSRTFDGLLDEMRLSTVTRDAGWAATEFSNQSDPAGFYTVSAPL